MPVYELVGKSGPHHDLRFTVSVAIKGVGEKQAEGSSKQEAETEAARQFLEEFGI
jgi:ribonuclease-3